MRLPMLFTSAVVGTAGFDIFHKLAGKHIFNFLGPFFVGSAEIVMSGIFFIFFYKPVSAEILISWRGAFLAFIVGVFAWFIDVGLLELYNRDSSLSKVAPFVVTSALALAAAFGMIFLDEPRNTRKIIGILTAILSCYLLYES